LEARTLSDGSIATHEETGEEEEHIHLPGSSPWPFGVAFFLFVAMVGFLTMPHFGSHAGIVRWIIFVVIVAIGAVGMGWSIVAWGVQISEA
jgi:hypothetical protein